MSLRSENKAALLCMFLEYNHQKTKKKIRKEYDGIIVDGWLFSQMSSERPLRCTILI